LDAFCVLDEVLDDYEEFVRGFLNIRDLQIRERVEQEIADGLLWPEPCLALNPAFDQGGSVGALVDRDEFHPACRDVFRHHASDGTERELALHRYQPDAIAVAARGESYVCGSTSCATTASSAPGRLVLDASDRMAAAMSGGPTWTPLADTPVGDGPRHTAVNPS
jgi:hypothetical protein